DDVVNELLQIKEWLENEDIRKDSKLSLPKGVLFYGDPGNGKTLLAREFCLALGKPVVEIDVSDKLPEEEVNNAFLKLKEYDFAVLFIDELDLLVRNRTSITRKLQTALDGFNQDNEHQFFVIATTNNIDEIPFALKRSGRFDKRFDIDRPSQKDLEDLYRLYCDKIGFKNDINYKFLSNISSHICCADIKAICNDAYLRYGENATTEELEASYNRVIDNQYSLYIPEEEKEKYRVAIHEVGHALMAYKNKEYFTFYRANFSQGGGTTHTFPVFKESSPFSKYIADMEIGLGGYYAEAIILKEGSGGAEYDLDEVRHKAALLVNRKGYISPYLTLPNDRYTRPESEFKRSINEKYQE
ncbi:MAG: AAA family ATPase, partial [Bacilli bacterium]|nr:AAA family ATPase [Bacilli bacterium]